ncbi:MAG: hypothetical protein ACRBCK_01100 [Alphaproteobacteria bacterium]
MAQDKAIPVNADAVEKLGLRDSYKIGLSDTMRVGLSQVDTVLLGDTGHDHYKDITGALGSKDVQVAIAESTGAHIFLELPEYRQNLVDQFQRRAADPGASPSAGRFADRFEYEVNYDANVERWNFNPEEATQDYLQNYVAPLLERSAQLGVDVHLLDQGKGMSEKELAGDLKNRLFETIDERKRVRSEQDVNDPRVQGRLEKLDRRYTELRNETYEAHQEFYEARHDDESLAHIVDRVASGEKSVVLFGGAHGSRHNDFEEHLKGSSLKIDIAVSREDYEGDYAGALARLRKFDERYGEDPADLVYFLDEGVLSTTVNTPSEVIKQIEAVAQPLDISEPVQTQDGGQPAVSTGVKP